MTKRRKNGEGTLSRSANGNWRVIVALNGKRYSFTSGTQADCLSWLTEFKHNASRGYDIEAGKVLLSDYIGNWLDRIKASRSPGTVDIYSRALVPVIEALGRYPIMDIRPDMIQALYDSLFSDGNSAHYVSKTHKALHVAYEQAVKLRIIPSNPVASARPPVPEKREMDFYDDGQVQTLLLTAQDIGDHYHPLYYLAIHTGMRQGELLALKWADINHDDGTLIVQRQLYYLKGGGFEYRSPKSRNGRRTISLGKESLDVLKVHRENQWEIRQRKGRAWIDNGLVFPSNVGTPVQPSNLRRSFRKLLKASGLPKIRFHDLRHTAASLMLNYGIPPLIVSQRLGHSKPSFTLDVYAHIIPHQQAEAAKLMDELMTPVALPTTPKLHPNVEI